MTSEDKRWWIKLAMQLGVWLIGIAAFIFTLSNQITILSTKFDNIVDTVNNISEIVEKIRTETIPNSISKHEERVHEGAATEKYVDKEVSKLESRVTQDIESLRMMVR